jgi:hypothetical protein
VTNGRSTLTDFCSFTNATLNASRDAMKQYVSGPVATAKTLNVSPTHSQSVELLFFLPQLLFGLAQRRLCCMHAAQRSQIAGGTI